MEDPRLFGPMPQVVVETTSTDARQAEQFLGMALVQIRAQHQTNVGNLAQRADPLAGCLGKSARFAPVVGKVYPARLQTDRLFESHNISRSDVMLIGVVRLGRNRTIEKSLVKFARRWRSENDRGAHRKPKGRPGKHSQPRVRSGRICERALLASSPHPVISFLNLAGARRSPRSRRESKERARRHRDNPWPCVDRRRARAEQGRRGSHHRRRSWNRAGAGSLRSRCR